MDNDSRVRVRVVGWNVEPVIMFDDGDNLTSVQVQPLKDLQNDWQVFVDGGWQQGLKPVHEQIENEP